MTEDRSPKASEEPAAAAGAARQRRKRKWDQPAESLISAGVALPGALPFGMIGIPGVSFPGVVPLSGAFLTNPIPDTFSTASQLFQSSSMPQNAAAIVQKLNQPKIQDELIAREIVINDAEATIRYKLTKRQTQEEIQKSTGAVVITRGKYRPPNCLPDSEKPLYLHISAGAHLKDTAERIKAVDRAASMIEELLKHGQNSMQVSAPFHSFASNVQVIQPFNTCVFLGFDTEPSLNIAARIRGPNDQYINHIMNETGATVVLRGRGSGTFESSLIEELQQPLHLYLSATNQKSLEDARILAENLMDTICAECGTTRISTCKVYGAVPPPLQLMNGVLHGSAIISETNGNSVAGLPCIAAGTMPATPLFSPTGAPVSTGSINCASGTLLQPGGLPSYLGPQPTIGSYSRPSVTGGTCYSGYGGIYPQATPLQQVALALRQAPALTTPALASITQSAGTSPKTSSSSSSETDKRPPQRRKFQELPVILKGPTTLNQNLRQEEFLKPGSNDLGMRSLSSMPPPKKMLPPESDGRPPPAPRNMPPPPPKFSAPQSPPKDESKDLVMKKSPPRIMPPPPPKAESRDPVMKKSSPEPVSDTLLKLVEYGEDDDFDVAHEESSEETITEYILQAILGCMILWDFGRLEGILASCHLQLW